MGDLAIEAYTKAIEHATNSAENPGSIAGLYTARGSLYVENNQYDNAKSDYAKALAYDKNNLSVYQHVADYYKNLGDFEQVLAIYEKRLRHTNENVLIYYSRAVLYQEIGFYRESIDDMERIQGLSSESEKKLMYLHLGSSYLQMREFEHAQEALKKHFKADEESNYIPAHVGLGITEIWKGNKENYEQSIRYLSLCVEKLNEEDNYYSAPVYLYLGVAKYLSQYQPDKIISDLQRGRTARLYTYALILLGKLHDDDKNAAIAYYTEAITREPEYAVAYLKRGRLYQRQGNVKDARRDFENAEKLAIGDTWRQQAQEALKRLKPEEKKP